MDADGDFVVSWTSYDPFEDASGFTYGSIHAQRYASDGSAVGDEFQVNSYTTETQAVSSVAMAAGGDFFVVWQSYGSGGTDSSSWSVQLQRYASDGSALGGALQVNSYTTNSQSSPSVASDVDGAFVVVWKSLGSSGTDSEGFSIQRTPVELIFADGFESGDVSAWCCKR